MNKPGLLRGLAWSSLLVWALAAVLLLAGTRPLVTLAVLLAALLALLFYFRSKLRSASGRISATLKQLAEGDHSQRIPALELAEFDRLGRELNQALAKLDGTIGHLAVHREELRLVLGSIEDVLWSQNYEGKLVWANEPFAALFPAYDEDRQQKYWEVIRAPELLDWIKTAAEPGPVTSSGILLEGHSYILSVSRNDQARRLLFVLRNIDAIEQTAQMKKDFIVNLAHELRTPLTAIKGFTEAMQDHPGQDHTRQLRIIHNHTQRLIHLIQDLEQLIRLESVSGLETQDISLETFFDNVRLILEPEVAAKNLYLRIEVDPSAQRLVCDPFRLEQVFINLIQNSLRYTDSGGITIRAAIVDDSMCFEVADTGKGIAETYLPRIFERFFVADPSRNKLLSGTGLGLAIVKHIVQLHHGSISVASQRGQGTAFKILIPLRNSALEDPHE